MVHPCVDALKRSVFLALLASALSCASGRQRPETMVLAPRSQSLPERMNVDDLVEIRVYGEGEMSGNYRVGTGGTIDFPLAGSVPAEGLTIAQLQAELVAKLKGAYLKDPQITIMYKERNNSKVSVLGQVQKPGPIPYYANMTIVDAIAAAGGFTGIAAKNSVTLRREANGQVELKTYPVADISEGRSTNVSLLPGDVVVVDERLF
jgi:protein involved in polysaccharide export with SLBB domain